MPISRGITEEGLTESLEQRDSGNLCLLTIVINYESGFPKFDKLVYPEGDALFFWFLVLTPKKQGHGLQQL